MKVYEVEGKCPAWGRRALVGDDNTVYVTPAVITTEKIAPLAGY